MPKVTRRRLRFRRFCHRLAEAGCEVHGFDLESRYISMANEAAARLGLTRCRFETSAINDFKCAKPFDAVLATDVLEHIQDGRQALRRLVSFDQPGGNLLITVPQGPWLFGHHDVMLGHFRRYTRRGLLELCGSPLRVRTIRSFGFFLIPIVLLYSRLLGRPYPLGSGPMRDPKGIVFILLKLLLFLEKVVPLPLGTSLLAMAGPLNASASSGRYRMK